MTQDNTRESDPADEPQKAGKDSPGQFWQASLGAFAKAQQEGAKAFESLVKDGLGMQKKAQTAAEDRLSQAQQRMSGFANEFGSKATDSWGKLEGIFEQRVARALDKLGMPSSAEVKGLQTRLDVMASDIAVLKRQLEERESESAAAPKASRAAVKAKAPKATKSPDGAPAKKATAAKRKAAPKKSPARGQGEDA